MGKSAKRMKLSTLHGALTAAAALSILVLSVLPSLSFVFDASADSGPFLDITSYGFICFLILICIAFTVTMQMYKMKIRCTLSGLHTVVTVTAAVVILVLSVMPPLVFGSGVPANSGVTLHIIAYSTLCFLICLWLRSCDATRFPVLYAFFFSSSYGLLIECIQLGLPYRGFEIFDIVINCLAAACAVVPCCAAIRYIPLYKKKQPAQELSLD